MYSVEIIAFIPTEINDVFKAQFWLNGLLIENSLGTSKELLMGNFSLSEEDFNHFVKK